MRCLRYLPLPSLLWALLASPAAHATPWKEDQVFFSENANVPSSKVDAADLDGDGLIDLVFANAAGYNKGDPGSPQLQQAFRNNGAGMEDISSNVFMGTKYNGRAVKLRDLDNDGDNDIFLGTTWFTQSQMFQNDGAGTFANDPSKLPTATINVGDVEVGDVDFDGDLDIVLANWGDDPIADGEVDAPGAGGVTLLWTQSGEPGTKGALSEVTKTPTSGSFLDSTGARMPNLEVMFSWDLDFVDFDNDYALDLAISTKDPNRSFLLFHNDGLGNFQVVNVDNVQGKASVDVEPWDLNGDSFLDIITLQDGQNRRNRVLVNDGNGGFVINADIWSQLQNPPSFDFGVAFADPDMDADADIVLGAFQNVNKFPDRMMVNEAGLLVQYDTGMPAPLQFQALEHTNVADQSAGTYSIVLADLNADTKLDIAMAQNENAFDKKVFLATEEALADINPPVIANYQKLPNPYAANQELVVRARVHDNKSPLQLHDFQLSDPLGFPYIESWTTEPMDPPEPGQVDSGQWYGEYLWRIAYTLPSTPALWWRLCAIDAAGNKYCTEIERIDCDPADPVCFPPDPTTGDDSTTTTGDDSTTMITSITTLETDEDSDTDSTTADDTGPVPTSTAVDPSTTTTGISETDSATTAGLDDDGCGCRTDDSPARNLAASLALLGLLGIRRRRR
ncbi:MAG: VCBS repeat-containing protein [Myxococcales bacterium]|nr:VCBS repeat-containing protein [Myxococcales bacterium]